MSEDYLKMFTSVVLLMFVIIVGYFFSERNDRKMFLLSSLVFLVINIACLYVLTASLWFLCGNYESGRSNGCSNGYWLITERYELRQVQKNIYLYYVVIGMVRSDVVFYKGLMTG
ncbi:conjugal transfer protein TrbA [Klebsiella pneumoniae]|uniref:Conjugal transfer protein TrbA n=1 Tax=Klebsiella pneumoniae TaxID=573 RepID=A0AB74H1K2_KLEPN|nr:conjugal transfer protein TrbA [Klebsiella pneumoniae]